MNDISLLYAGCDVFHGCTVRHAHRGWEILYILDGMCNIYFDDVQYTECVPGNLFVIPPNAAHERTNLTQTKTCFAVFETGNSAWNDTEYIHTGRDRLFERWMEDLAELHKSNLPEQSSAVLKAVLHRIHYLTPKHDNESGIHPAVLRSCRFMAEHFSENLTITDIAEKSSVSQSHLNLLFRSCLGTTPLQYLRTVRMQAAKQLLLNPYCNISEVAAACGFEDMHYFTRVFKKFYGVPPGEFRNNSAEFSEGVQSRQK